MSENFDIGPLTWVKDEINQALDAVKENLAVVQGNLHDTSVLRFSQTHLYQASGAFDMVGLQGCKRFCTEMEKLASKLEKQEIAATSEHIEVLSNAVQALQNYLEDLLNGAPDVPLKLYPALGPVVAASGELLEESDLFFPDTSNSAPKDIPFRELSDADYASYVVEQRLAYQKSLLTWLQTKQNAAVEAMAGAVSNVGEVQVKSANKTLWWAASAFAESLEQKEIAEHQGAKKLCRKIDQELKTLAEGQNKPHNNLLRDILYYVAISDIDKDKVRKVKEVFELDLLVDKKSDNQQNQSLEADEIALLSQLTTDLEGLIEIWDEVSNSIDFSKFDAKDGAARVDVDNVLITKFADAMVISQKLSEKLSQSEMVNFYRALQEAANTLRDHKDAVNHASLIEIAAALNLLELSLQHYQHLDADRLQKIVSEINLLGAISSAEGYDRLATERTSELDRDTVKVVMGHVKEALKVVEQALDSFFRNPNDKAPLGLIATPLKQVRAVFEMLSMPTLTAVLNTSGRFVQYFQQDDYTPNQSQFELVAESLSMVGLYADEMPKPRPESDVALEAALVRLNDALAAAGVEIIEEPAVAVEVSAPAIIETVQELAQQNTVVSPVDESGEKVVDRAYDPELLDIYLTEAEEVLAHIAQNLQALRVNITDNNALVEVRRSFHTLKGSGRTVGLSALGEIAGKVESFFNGILDKKHTLNTHQVAAVELVAAAFADWTAELRAKNKVEVAQEAWFAKVAEFSELGASESADTAAEKDDSFVLIAGTRKLSRQLYEIFINESMRNITTLEQDIVKISDGLQIAPSTAARQATHTVASNALAAGFTPMGELCRALEAWLDEVDENSWTAQHFELYQNTVKTVSTMWQKASEKKNPRAANALIKVLHEATQLAIQNKELAVPSDAYAVTEEIVYTADDEDATIELVEPTQIQEELDTGIEVETISLGDVSLSSNNLSENDGFEDELGEPEAAVEMEVKLITESKPDSFAAGLDTTGVNPELLTMFVQEANEILPEIGSELRAWRASPKDAKHPDALQRALHTLKGSARMAGQKALGDAVHEMEDLVVRSLKRKNEAIDFEILFADLDQIGSYFDNSITNTPDESVKQVVDTDAPHTGRSADRKAQFLRMRADTLDRLINEAGEISIIRSRMDRELSGFKHSSTDLTESLNRLRGYLRELEIEAETQLQSRMSILQETNETFDPLEFDRFTRLQELTRMIAESVNDVATIQNNQLSNLGQTEAALQQQNRMNRDLQQSLLSVRMLPFKQISERMQRIVRQTARELKKSADLVIHGEDTEIDRSMLDKLGAPMEHLLRNAVAHGIESPSERKKMGKPETGTITLKLRQENDEIHIVVSDDGAGVNLDKVKEKAIKNKLIDADSNPSEQALLSVIFETGFSTADKVSQIAGRGVGLDVVRSDISGLGGRVDLNSAFGAGTTFDIHLPVTLSVAQVLVVRSGDAVYALPVAMIEQAQKIKRQDLVNAYQAGEIRWADNAYPLHYLSKLLDHQEHQPEDHAYVSVLLLRSASLSIALHVDEVLGNQEVVMKQIGSQLARVPGIVGATVAGDGSIMLIINPVQLANREVLGVGAITVKPTKGKAKKEVTKPRLLVVDDSLTMRKVLGRLLEREGFEVLVAKDGMDAMQLLQEITPDAILTDIEMPRMDGFGLSRNIRDDARTAKTPLIMISSRTADKHQNLAREIGVDAFFGKPVQDEELVAKIRELLANKRVLH